MTSDPDPVSNGKLCRRMVYAARLGRCCAGVGFEGNVIGSLSYSRLGSSLNQVSYLRWLHKREHVPIPAFFPCHLSFKLASAVIFELNGG